MTQLPGPPKSRTRKASKAERQEAAKVITAMQESGEYKRLQEKLLTDILSKDPEWWDAIRARTREVMQTKDGGVLDITLDELSAELVPTGKAAVPEALKQAFILGQIQPSMEQQQLSNNKRKR